MSLLKDLWTFWTKKFFVTDFDDELGIGAEGSQNIYGAVPSSIRGRGGRGFSIAGLRRHGPGKVLDHGSAWEYVASASRRPALRGGVRRGAPLAGDAVGRARLGPERAHVFAVEVVGHRLS